MCVWVGEILLVEREEQDTGLFLSRERGKNRAHWTFFSVLIS